MTELSYGQFAVDYFFQIHIPPCPEFRETLSRTPGQNLDCRELRLHTRASWSGAQGLHLMEKMLPPL